LLIDQTTARCEGVYPPPVPTGMVTISARKD
jgi:hypothetical protein